MKCSNTKNNKEFAVKILNSKQSTRLEVEALKLCRKHTNIVQFVECMSDDAYTYIITEWLRGEELFKRAQEQRFTENEVKIMFSQIVDAVEYMHDKGIIHRDLKLENIMLVGNRYNPLTLKIVDFGFACKRDSEEAAILCYTLDYVAPEVLCNEKIAEACDLWSLGVILYTLLCGQKPFRSDPKPRKESDNQIRDRIRTGSFDRNSSAWHRLSEHAKDLITRLLTVNVEERLNIRETARHAWLIESPVGSPEESPAQSPIQSPTTLLREEDYADLEKQMESDHDESSRLDAVETDNDGEIVVDDEEDSLHQEPDTSMQEDDNAQVINETNDDSNASVQSVESAATAESTECIEIPDCIDAAEGSEAAAAVVEDISDVEDIIMEETEPMEVEISSEPQTETPTQSHEDESAISTGPVDDEECVVIGSDCTKSDASIDEHIEPNRRSNSELSTDTIELHKALINNNDKFLEAEPKRVVPIYSPISFYDEPIKVDRKPIKVDDEPIEVDDEDTEDWFGWDTQASITNMLRVIDLDFIVNPVKIVPQDPKIMRKFQRSGSMVDYLPDRTYSSSDDDDESCIYVGETAAKSPETLPTPAEPEKEKPSDVSVEQQKPRRGRKRKIPETPTKSPPAKLPRGGPKRITRASARRPEIESWLKGI